MAELERSLDATIGQNIEAVLQRLRNSKDLSLVLMPVLDIAIRITGAEMGTIQRFDENADCLHLVASRGFSREAVSFFGIVRRDTNTTCAAAFTRRMRVFVENVSTSYLFVGTPELDMLRANGVAAAQSTPLISGNGQFWGVLSTHFRKAQIESAFDHLTLDSLVAQIAGVSSVCHKCRSFSGFSSQWFGQSRAQNCRRPADLIQLQQRASCLCCLL